MIKTIDIAGIQLDNYSVHETIMNLEREMSDLGFHSIEEVNTELLMLAESDELVKSALEVLEHTVISDPGILEVVGAGNYQRKHEIERHDFFYELMKRIERGRKRVYLLGEKPEETDEMLERIQTLYPRCSIVGAAALIENEGADETVVNEINSMTVDVLISILPSPMQEHFLMDNRDKLSVNLWYGMGKLPLKKNRRRIRTFIQKYIRAHRLEKRVNSYSSKQENL